ncbi:hypothetical protein MASR2M70_04370 [Bacillota bacterium]
MKEDAHDLAMKYLAHRDRTSKEIRDHLTAKGVQTAAISECLKYLTRGGYVNDEEYCGKYILYSMDKGRGPLRIIKELSDKGVPSDFIDPAIEEHFGGDGERNAAEKVVGKLLGPEWENSQMSEKDVARIGRQLASRGFHSHVIYEIVGRLISKQVQVDRD